MMIVVIILSVPIFSEFMVVLLVLYSTPVTQRQPTRQRTTNATEINKQPYGVNIFWEILAMDQSDLWQIVPRQEFTPYSHLLLSTALVFLRQLVCTLASRIYYTALAILNLKVPKKQLNLQTALILMPWLKMSHLI